ncbi:MAG: hypothetical protein AB1801_22555 [Chloroflexota bacterium]
MRRILFIFGSFCVGFNAARASHELGHVIALWLSGGRGVLITLHPFTWSFAGFQTNPNPLATAWGGVILGPSLALLLLLISWPFRKRAYLALVLTAMTAVCSLAHTGLYLLVGTALDAGDPGSLLRLGMPRPLLLGLGLLTIIGACFLTATFLSLIGLASGESLGRRALLLELGILPYLLLMLAYQLIHDDNPAGLRFWLVSIGAVPILILFIALSPHLLSASLRYKLSLPAIEPSWKAVVGSLGLGALVVVGELVVF